MTEFSKSILGIFTQNSTTLALTYTFGHIIIAANVIYWFTGATIWEAGAVALIEPAINGLWFFILHKVWIHVTKN
tara:strand:- start:103 stop:327 length:225 start_codon:yes stop_codon:yes gene_type:complete